MLIDLPVFQDRWTAQVLTGRENCPQSPITFITLWFPITSSKIGAASGTDCQVKTIEVLSKKGSAVPDRQLHHACKVVRPGHHFLWRMIL